MFTRRALITSSKAAFQPIKSSHISRLTRSFRTTAARRDGVIGSAPARKPIGAFRGGLFGFFLGSSGAGAAMYYYILEDYRLSNQLLTEDIFALQAAVQRIESYTKNLEAEVADMQKKKMQS